MRRVWQCIGLIVLTLATARAQRYPILPVPGSPHGISALMQDSRSALWMGSADDVYCFDGQHFYSLRRYGFPAEEPIALAEDSEHGIWIATRGSTAAVGPAGGNLYRYLSGHVEKVYSGMVIGMVSAGPGTMLVSAFDATRIFSPSKDSLAYRDLYVFRKTQAGWQRSKVPGAGAKQLTVDHQGNVLFPCPEGWCELSQAQVLAWPRTELQPLFHKYASGDHLGRVLRDRYNCLWFRDARRAAYQCPGQPVTMVPDSTASLDGLIRLEEAVDGSIVMAGPGLVMGRPGAMHILPVVADVHGIGPMLPAHDGTLFIANDDGLYRFMYPFRLEYWDRNAGFTSAYFVSRIGKQMLASNQGIQLLDSNGTRWTQLASAEEVGTTVHMIAAPQETIYAASISRGVLQLDREGHVLARSDGKMDGTRLASDFQGRTWLAGRQGIKLIQRHGDRLDLASQGMDTGGSLDLKYDPAHRALWACHDSAVAVLQDDHWTELFPKDGLLDDACRSIALLDDEVWVGYASAKAVSRIRRAPTGKFVIDTFPLTGPNEESYTTFLESDRRGWLWRASDHADFIATPDAAEHGDWLRLDGQDGIPSPGGNQNSFLTDDDGSVWFANDNYAIHFTPPDGFATQFPPPRIFVAGFSVGSNRPALAETVQRVAHGEPLIAHIGSLQFDRRNALQLRYRLLPGQQEWKTADAFDLPLGRLASGRYTFEVQGRLLTGEWAEVERASFQVLWPLWMSWPSLLLLSAGGTGIGVGVSRWKRTRRLRREVQLPDISDWRMEALSPEAGDLIGTVIEGRYEVAHILSLGPFATVATARDLGRGGELCAIKIFCYGPEDRNWIHHRFRQEVAALEQLSHPNIVRITGHGVINNGAPYLVMEFIHGVCLRELLGEGPLPRRQIADFLLQIASALAELHRRSIYHRDLKPDNLMVRSGANGEQQFVLIDFSISIVKSPERTLHGISRVAGTVGYMAPEQVIGYADPSTDIHALAKVIAEMLTGRRWAEIMPEGTLDMPEFLRRYLERNPCGLGAESIAMLASALAFDPIGRPNDVIAFAATLLRDLEETAGTFN